MQTSLKAFMRANLQGVYSPFVVLWMILRGLEAPSHAPSEPLMRGFLGQKKNSRAN